MPITFLAVALIPLVPDCDHVGAENLINQNQLAKIGSSPVSIARRTIVKAF